MALKLIGAGFGRTGTWSTFVALNQLGFPCYHMHEVLMNPDNKHHLAFWRKVAHTPPGTRHDWDIPLAHYTATVDNPACCVWRELLAANPDAKVLLTLHPRGAEAWYDSTIDTIYFTENLWQFRVLYWLTPFGRAFGDMSRRLIWGRVLNGVMDDKAKAIARYEDYIDEVKAAVPPDRLLVFTVTEGWGPLCAFLGVPEPTDAFPNLNDRAAVKQVIAGIIRGAYVTLGLYAVGAAVVAGGLAWLLG